MNDQGTTGWPQQPGQSPPPGYPPGQPPGSPPGMSPPPPYSPPPGASYGAPPPEMPPGQAYSPPGQPYSSGPLPAQPPYPGAPYGQPGYDAAPAAKKRRARWILIPVVIGALLVVGVIAVAAYFATLTPAVSNIEFAHNFQDNKAVGVTDTFKPSDPTFFAVIHLTTTKGNPSVKIIWTVLDATDATTKNHVTSQPFGEAELIATTSLLYASVPRPATPWPVGQYKAEVFLDGKLAKTAQFTVTA